MNRPVLLSTIALVAFCHSVSKRKAPHHSSDTRKIVKKLTSFSAKVGDSGKTLTADKDNKIGMVSNPETLRGIDGRHVKVKAIVDATQSQIRIVSVSEIADEQAGIRFHDAAFRR
jgi:hypothetical protein